VSPGPAKKLNSAAMVKILQIGNYPPPECGWAVQTKLLAKEIRRRGHICEVLNINESRRIKSPEYVDVQNGLDYILKLFRFALRGYRFQVNVNGQSKPGYVLAALALIVGRLAGRAGTLSWRGGLQQRYFPREDSRPIRWAYRQLFRLAGSISCDSMPVKRAIESYGICPDRVVAIPPFSRQNLAFKRVPLAGNVEAFLTRHRPVFFCYVSYRPEYELPNLREAMRHFRKDRADAGFIWLGFPSKEMPAVESYVNQWSSEERRGLLLLGNLGHDEFLSLLTRCTAYLRTPMCDGVAASILESLALGVPVIASDNGTRPEGVVTYRECDEADMRAKLEFVVTHYEQVKQQTHLVQSDDNIDLTVNWLLQSDSPSAGRGVELAHVR
jgi:glycosyltransferase involved in cell wall biosynthesis